MRLPPQWLLRLTVSATTDNLARVTTESAAAADDTTRVEHAPPRVGTLSAWFDPENPVVWSGVPKGVVTELQRLGVHAFHRNVGPPVLIAKAVYQWMKLTRRQRGWTRRGEMRVVSTISDALRRAQTPDDVDGWVHFVGGHGPVVNGRYATLFEMSPSQLQHAPESFAAPLGYQWSTPSRRAWVARRQASTYRHAYACCMASHWAADSLIRDHGVPARRVHVVGYGRNADIPAPPDRDWSSPRFLFIGRDWPRKNGDAVIRAFQRVRADVPGARLDVVGGHPPLAVEGVTGHGLLAVHEPEGRAAIESLFAQATCFVVPSQFEPFGIVYVEAAAAGVPSIAGSIGGTADSVGDGGVLVDPYEDDDIAHAMRQMCDPDAARALGALALARSVRFTWSATGQRVVRSLDLDPIPGVELADFL